MDVEIWRKLGLLSDEKAREIACFLCETPGRKIKLKDLVEMGPLKKFGASSSEIRRLAKEMHDADLLDRSGDKKTGYLLRLKSLHVKELTWATVYEMHRGKRLSTSER